jgi:5-amino-6-(5-phosphoribosylamino)uracil reductase
MTDAPPNSAGAGSTRVQQIFPAAAELDAAEIATSLELPSRPGADPELPRVVACWIASLDGRSTLGRRSSGLGSAADRAVFRGLRAEADAMLVGSRTLAIERYRRPGRDPRLRERRAALGLAEEPTVLVISREPSLPIEIPLLQDPAAKVRILTWGDAKLPSLPAIVDVTKLPRGGEPMRGALAAARAAGIASVVCEGGPTLLGLLIAEDLLDELVVTTAPMFVGSGELPIVTGSIAHPLRRFGLAALYRGEDHVFAHYVRAREAG